jgi:outer membrane autotransporter protein
MKYANRGFGRGVAIAFLGLAGAGAHQTAAAQETPISVLTRLVNSQSQQALGRAIGTICPAGNRLTARLQADCNALVGAAFQGDPGVAAALRQITPDNVNASFDRSNAQAGARTLAGLHGSLGSTSLGFVEEEDGVVLAFLPNLEGAAYAAASEVGPWSVFAHLDLADYRRDASLNEDGFDADRRVVTVGIDRRFSDTFNAGIAVGFGNDDLEFTSGSGSQDIDELRLLAYASWVGSQGWYLDALANWQQRDVDQVRRVAYTLGSGVAVDQRFSADFDSDVTSLSLNLGRTWQHEAFGWNPYVGVEWSSIEADGYTEQASAPDANGAGWAIVAPDADSDVTTANLGLRVDWAISGANGVWVPQLDVAFVQVLSQDEDSLPVNLSGDLSPLRQLAIERFAIRNDEEDDNYIRAGLGLVAQWSQGRSGFINLARHFGNGRYVQTELTFGFRVEF